jgi:DNA recombination protein RmuC
VLEESGLRNGHEYETQVKLDATDGQRRYPDVIVRLPDNKDIVIDSKVSLVDYERYCSADDEEQRKIALARHAGALKEHIKGLSIKDYENLEGLRTLDFVFMFIPIEAAFLAAFEFDQTMFRDAYEKNIIVVSPTTLLASLRTVQSIWRYERQNKNAEEIARQAGALHDKFVRFIEDLDEVGKQLKKTQDAHESAYRKLVDGPGNLVRSTMKLEKLGAKVKKSMPAALAQQVDQSLLVDDAADETS